jgi:hypothetical protein
MYGAHDGETQTMERYNNQKYIHLPRQDIIRQCVERYLADTERDAWIM